jgi:hypothetical protein
MGRGTDQIFRGWPCPRPGFVADFLPVLQGHLLNTRSVGGVREGARAWQPLFLCLESFRKRSQEANGDAVHRGTHISGSDGQQKSWRG